MNRPGIASGFTDEGESPVENLIAGDFPRIVRVVTITGGAVLKTGSVLGQITASGSYQLSKATASDGSEVPCAILADDVDASGDTSANVYLTGEFLSSSLVLGAGHTIDSVSPPLRLRSVFLR